MKSDLDESTTFTPRFAENGLIPAIAVDHATGDVLMLAYMNDQALQRTLQTGEVHYWSRSRQELWHKGATSGNIQKVVRLLTDCDQDAILIRVTQKGPACHTGRQSCFYREVASEPKSEDALTMPLHLTFTDDA